jgi:hypothetical protein
VKALSIRQPWAHAIVHLGKRIENREWQHAPSYRGPLLIHASSSTGTRDDFDSAVDAILDIVRPTLEARRDLLLGHAERRGDRRGGGLWVPSPDETRGALVARARLVEVVKTNDKRHRLSPGYVSPCLLCGGYPEKYEGGAQWREDCPKADPWAIPGQLGFILDDVEPLAQPIPFKGKLGFFEVPDSVLR